MEETKEETKTYTVEEFRTSVDIRHRIHDALLEHADADEAEHADLVDVPTQELLDVYNQIVTIPGTDLKWRIRDWIFDQSCSHCGEVFVHSTEMVYTERGDVCESCYDDYYRRCSDCDNADRETSMRYSDSDEEWYCESCYIENNHEEEVDEVDADDVSSATRSRYPINHRRGQAIVMGSGSELGEIVKSQRGFSGEIEFYGTKWTPLAQAIKALPDAFGISGDGSLNSSETKDGKRILVALEVQTAIMKGKVGEEIMQKVYKSFAEAGGYVNRTCGLHIHLDMKNERGNVEVVKRLFAFHYIFEDVIQSFLPKERRVNQYCRSLKSSYNLEAILKAETILDIGKHWYATSYEETVKGHMSQHRDSTRYHGINMHTLLWDGHVEIRYHSGTLNARKMLEWVNLHARIVDFVSGTLNKPSKVLENVVVDGKEHYVQQIMKIWNDTEGRALRSKIAELQDISNKLIGYNSLVQSILGTNNLDTIKRGVYMKPETQDNWGLEFKEVPIPETEKAVCLHFFEVREELGRLQKLHATEQKKISTLAEKQYDTLIAELYAEQNEALPDLKKEIVAYKSKNIAEKTKALFKILDLSETSKEYLLSRQEKFAGQADYTEDDIEIKPLFAEELLEANGQPSLTSEPICVE